MPKAIEIATSVYGNSYANFLLPCLFSIVRADPDAVITVYWQDVDVARITAVARMFPRVRWIETSYDIAGSPGQRIASKVMLWRDAVSNAILDDLLLIDSDTLSCGQVNEFFDEEFDVGFTHKNEQFPLNTGVMLIKRNDASRAFFEQWLSLTSKIIADPQKMQKATSPEFPYGAADQMSLFQLLQYDRERVQYDVPIGGVTVRLKAFPCKILNETNSVPVTPEKRILHYKGGWHPILLRGAGYTRNRPKSASVEMHLLYLKTYSEALRYAFECGVPDARSLFDIKFPWYLDPDSFKESRVRYFIFCAINLWYKVARKIASNIASGLGVRCS